MKLLKIFVCFLWFQPLLAVNEQFACKPVLSGCNSEDDDNPTFLWHRYVVYTVYLTFEPTCRPEDITINWRYTNEKGTTVIKKFKDCTYFVFAKDMLALGKGILEVTITHSQKTTENKIPKSTHSSKCFTRTTLGEPIPVISGGHNRLVPANRDLILNAGNSIDVEKLGKSNMEFKWNNDFLPFCESEKGRREKLVIPKSFLSDGSEYTLILEVGYKGKEETKTTTQTAVTARSGVSGLELNCLRNCYPESNYNVATVFKVSCYFDCPLEATYKWKISDGSKDLKEDTTLSDTFEVSPGEFDWIGGYTVLVSLLESEASMEVIQTIPDKCSAFVDVISNSEDISLSFLLVEFTSDFRYIFQKAEDVENDGILIAKWNGREIFSLIPASTSDISEYIVKENYFYTTCSIEMAKRQSILEGAKSLEEQLKKITNKYFGKEFNTVATAMRFRDIYKTIQLLNLVISETKNIKSSEPVYKDFVVNLTKTIYTDLLKFPLASAEEVLSISGLLEHLVGLREPNNHNDHIIGRLGSRLCKKIAKSLSDVILRDNFQEMMYWIVKRISLSLLRATMIDFKPNFHHTQMVNSNEPEELDWSMLITEDYPTYFEPVPNLKNFEEIAMNAIEANALLGFAMASTMIPKESPMRMTENKLNWVEVITYREIGQNLPKQKIFHDDCTIIPSEDFLKRKNERFKVVFQAWKSNPIWFERIKLYSGVFDLKFYADEDYNTLVTKFENPLTLVFKHLEFTEYKKIVCEFDAIVEWDDGVICALRVNVESNAALCIEFMDLNEEEFEIVATGGKKPTLDDFQNSALVKTGRTSVNVLLGLHYDSVQYFGVIPSRKKSREKSGNVSVCLGFGQMHCLRYDMNDKIWTEKSCKVGGDSSATQITCKCYHASPFSVTFTSPVVVQEKYLESDIFLTLQLNWLIMYFILVTYLIYFLALNWWGKFNHNTSFTAFFVADNFRTDRYAYLFVIRTGSKRGSGTTSNVMVQLHGDTGVGVPHVLNYPDPERFLLQRSGLDRFVTAEKHHLGVLRKLHVWIDGIGHNPEWLCEEIWVYDLQLEVEYYFGVKRWFSAMKWDVMEVSVEETEPPEKRISDARVAHTWNLQTGAENNNFSYLKKITVLLSIVLTTVATTLVIYGPPTDDFSDAISYYGHYNFYPQVFYYAVIAAVFSFIMHIGIVIIFRCSNTQFPVRESRLKYKWTVLAWCLCISLILISTTLLLYCCFKIGYITAQLILTSVFCSLLIEIVIFENVFIFILKLIGCKTKLYSVLIHFPLKNAVIQAEIQRKYLVEKFGDELLRPLLTHLYVPLDGHQIKFRRMNALTKIFYGKVLIDLVMFMSYVILLYVVILTNRNPMTIHSHNILKDIFVDAVHSRKLKFSNIRILDNFYDYVDKTLIPSLQATFWYNTWRKTEPGLIGDFSSKILGIARLRQHRILKNEICSEWAYEHLNMSCHPMYSVWTNAEIDYDPGWMPKTNEHRKNEYNDFWTYQEDIGVIDGYCAWYPGGGYISYLGRTIQNMKFNLDYLKAYNWIDEKTRAIIIDFLIYNNDFNVFVAVNLMVELSPSGTCFKSATITPAKLILDSQASKTSSTIFAIILISVLTVFFMKVSQNFIKHPIKFFKSAWNIMDLLIFFLSCANVALVFYRSTLVDEMLENIVNSKHNAYVAYVKLFNIEITFTSMVAILICAATIRLWKFLRIGMIFQIMEKTMIYSFFELLNLTLCLGTISFVFALCSVNVFGGVIYDFSNIIKALKTVWLLSLSLHATFNHDVLYEVRGSFGWLLYILYLVITFIFLGIYVTIIINAYEKARAKYMQRKGYTFEHFLRYEALYYYELIRVKGAWWRMSGGGTDNSHLIEDNTVQPIAEQYRFADTYVLRKKDCRAMKAAILGWFDNLERKQANFERMKNIISFSLKEEDEEDSQVQRFIRDAEGNFVKESKLLKMEYLTKAAYKDDGRKGGDFNQWNGKLKKVEDNLEELLGLLKRIKFKDVK